MEPVIHNRPVSKPPQKGRLKTFHLSEMRRTPQIFGIRLDRYISVFSANKRASSISTPRYLTVFSIFEWPSKI